ncbi:6-phosphogluconolactonase [Microbacterium endophyticum]|uniref:6-phosphogluconolactonase n=1 Tax=Microbacterium endophyticum TaxID=1526412 RepID=A0A7W4V4W8_9MICO|nr:6-phosphogluconolactonase [Microbacterium endophyticum]MBB2976769.1 6-phosphogluconolactonase [Microbacterium endophyticum]NIK36594.1 6-phosphogluconolactonase [Microbacterium endophyticum]
MTSTVSEKRVIISPDAAHLAAMVSKKFLNRVVRRIEGDRLAHIVLTGGSMGGAVLAAAANNPLSQQIDWSKVHFWWGDERFVSSTDADRNDVQARAAFLDAIDIPASNIHAVASTDSGEDIDAAAAAYAEELAQFATAEHAWPAFDICFLGVGPDAHIASLFPDRAEIQVTDRATVAVRDSPKPPPNRVSLTRPVINSAKRVWLVMSGPDKAAALGLALAGASYESVPAAGAKGRRRTAFFVDEAAASQVPPELIDGEY